MKILVFSFAFLCGCAAIADIFDVPKTQAVLNKKYDFKDELTLQLNYLPKDAFSKYAGPAVSYTHAFSDFTSWEIINAGYNFELMSGLKKQLLDTGPSGYSADPSLFSAQSLSLTSNIVFSPIYSKNLLFNSSIVYSQFSFVMGGGVTLFSPSVVPTIDVGFIFRFFLTPTSYFKFDIRYDKYLTSIPSVADNYTLSLGYAFSIGGKDKNADGF